MKKIIYYLSIITLLILSNSVKGQDCSRCDIALITGAREEFESKTNSKYDEATSELFNHDYNYWDSYKSSNSQSTSIDAAYKLFSTSFSNSHSSSESKQKFESMKTNFQKNHTLSQSEQQFISSKVASKTAYAAWTSCIQTVCGKGGILLEKEGNNDNEFILSLKWIPTNGIDSYAIITNIVSTNCQLNGGDLQVNAKIFPWNSLLRTVKRIDSSQDATITVSISNFLPQTVTILKGETSETKPLIILPSSVPVGTVVAFAGNNIPTGWLICDGTIKNQNQYSPLYNSLGTIWGSGDGSPGSFNLPDMRGMFLRGVDYDANNDIDKDSRTPQHNGGQSGNKVGSVQNDEFKKHNHKANMKLGAEPTNGGARAGSAAGSHGMRTPTWESDGLVQITGISNETRPKNVYVIYIIKY